MKLPSPSYEIENPVLKSRQDYKLSLDEETEQVVIYVQY